MEGPVVASGEVRLGNEVADISCAEHMNIIDIARERAKVQEICIDQGNSIDCITKVVA